MLRLFSFFFFFFFNDTATTEIYTLSLHDALPIYRRLDPQHVAWVCSRLVFDHRLAGGGPDSDRKSTRLNSSHLVISYAVFCLKKKKWEADVNRINFIHIQFDLFHRSLWHHC